MTQHKVQLFPAIDLRGGQAVRLYQGDYAQETVYSNDPVDIARQFADEGATWLHVVDLDGAKDGISKHGKIVADIIASTNLNVELGGGIRNNEDIRRGLDLGVQRVIVGTAAAENPSWFAEAVQRYPGQLVAGVDVKNGKVATRGWIESSGVELDAFIELINEIGPAALVYTEISKDGAMQGPDLEGLRNVLTKSAVPVIASGGISSVDDILSVAELVSMGPLEGIISGRALYEQAFTVRQAVDALR